MAVKLGVKDKEELKPQEFAPTLEWPYLGKAQLVEVNKEDRGQGDKKWPTLNFDFALHGDEDREGGKTPKGIHYVHAEFPPREDDEDEKTENLVKRIAYICSYFMGEENALKVTTVEGDTLDEAWENLRTKVVRGFQALKKKKDYTKKVVKIKVIGSVWQSKDSLRFPNYIGFISDSESEHPVSFSRSEKKNNREFVAFQSHAPSADNSTDFEDVGDDEALDF